MFNLKIVVPLDFLLCCICRRVVVFFCFLCVSHTLTFPSFLVQQSSFSLFLSRIENPCPITRALVVDNNGANIRTRDPPAQVPGQERGEGGGRRRRWVSRINPTMVLVSNKSLQPVSVQDYRSSQVPPIVHRTERGLLCIVPKFAQDTSLTGVRRGTDQRAGMCSGRRHAKKTCVLPA